MGVSDKPLGMRSSCAALPSPPPPSRVLPGQSSSPTKMQQINKGNCCRVRRLHRRFYPGKNSLYKLSLAVLLIFAMGEHAGCPIGRANCNSSAVFRNRPLGRVPPAVVETVPSSVDEVLADRRTFKIALQQTCGAARSPSGEVWLARTVRRETMRERESSGAVAVAAQGDDSCWETHDGEPGCILPDGLRGRHRSVAGR